MDRPSATGRQDAARTPPADAADEPVTLVITRRVKAGHTSDYEAWLARLQAEARTLPGYLGVTTQRPAPGAPKEYTSVLRFASLADLRHFERSELRRRYLAEVTGWVEADAAWRELTGLEFWFTPPAGTVVPQPSRPRMALVMVVVVFSLVLTIGSGVHALASMLPVVVPDALRLLVTITLEVLLMTYWLMPLLTRRLAFWIYPRRAVAR
jgi:antibiotic biosynthesis monooxygenase (ABM) superfamily enzyme